MQRRVLGVTPNRERESCIPPNTSDSSSLLISLSILKSLIQECKRDLNLFARSIIGIVHLSLDVKVYQRGGLDLEVVGRAASCFTAYTTFTDGTQASGDDPSAQAYLTVLRKLASMAVEQGQTEKPDAEQVSRTRLIGLGGLNGAAMSDAMLGSNAQFPKQCAIVLPALLSNLFQGSIEDLKLETAKIQMDASPSPFFAEYSARRPLNDRRAPSLHAHIPGEMGPTSQDVGAAALRTLHGLVKLCQIHQMGQLLDATIAFLDKAGWRDVERSCWLAEILPAFAMLQCRFVVPTRLIELLVDIADGPPTAKSTTTVAMITTILNSSVSLVGIGIADILNSLVNVIVRRIHLDSQDALLPPLVQCVASLAIHIYYADQINDIIEELSGRIAQIPQSDTNRQEILRVLVYCILGVMNVSSAAEKAETAHQLERIASNASKVDKGKSPQTDTPATARRRTGRRSPITPQVWQETLPLLCESTFAVRIAYARALLLYIINELPRESAKDLSRPGDLSLHRFCNALHASIYTLAMSSCLGAGSPAPSVETSAQASPHNATTETLPPDNADQARGPSSASLTPRDPNGKSPKGVSFPAQLSTSVGRRTPPKLRIPRRVSLPLNRVNSAAVLSHFENVATPFDFAAIIEILKELHAAAPLAALTTGSPMMLALDRDAGVELVRRQGDGRAGAWVMERKRAIRETILAVWRKIAVAWGVASGIALVDKVSAVELLRTGRFDKQAINTLPEPFIVPNLTPDTDPSVLPVPPEPSAFYRDETEGESSATSQPLLDPESLIAEFAASSKVQEVSGSDANMITKRMSSPWSVEIAVKDCTCSTRPRFPLTRQRSSATLPSRSLPPLTRNSTSPTFS